MASSTTEYVNINAKPIILTSKKIGSALDGCQFTIKFKKEVKNKLYLSFILPAFFILLRHLNCDISAYYIFTACILAISIYIEYCNVRKETVLIIPFVGIQYTTEYGFKMEKNHFIHWQTIDGVIINEVIHMHSIIYILTVIVKDFSQKTSLVTLFKNTKPRLKCLEIIYQEMEKILDNKTKDSKS